MIINLVYPAPLLSSNFFQCSQFPSHNEGFAQFSPLGITSADQHIENARKKRPKTSSMAPDAARFFSSVHTHTKKMHYLRALNFTFIALHSIVLLHRRGTKHDLLLRWHSPPLHLHSLTGRPVGSDREKFTFITYQVGAIKTCHLSHGWRSVGLSQTSANFPLDYVVTNATTDRTDPRFANPLA